MTELSCEATCLTAAEAMSGFRAHSHADCLNNGNNHAAEWSRCQGEPT